MTPQSSQSRPSPPKRLTHARTTSLRRWLSLLVPVRILPSLHPPWRVVSTLAVCPLALRLFPLPHVSPLPELPPDARSEDVSKFFDGYGRIVDCRVMTGMAHVCQLLGLSLTAPYTGFGFVEFESSRDAEDALHHFNGKTFMGAKYASPFLVSSPSELMSSAASLSSSQRRLALAAILTRLTVLFVLGVPPASVSLCRAFRATLAGRCVPLFGHPSRSGLARDCSWMKTPGPTLSSDFACTSARRPDVPSQPGPERLWPRSWQRLICRHRPRLPGRRVSGLLYSVEIAY